jgi:hypothetical protein
MYQCKQPKDTLAASSGSATPSMIKSASSRNVEPVRARNGRVADHNWKAILSKAKM